MEELFPAFEKGSEYPRTVLRQKHFAHTQDSYIQKLDDREGTLFGDEDEAEFDFWEAPGPSQGYKPINENEELWLTCIEHLRASVYTVQQN
jgi:hypothetical protein